MDRVQAQVVSKTMTEANPAEVRARRAESRDGVTVRER